MRKGPNSFDQRGNKNVYFDMTYQGIDASNHSIYNEDEENLVVGMANTIIYPIAMVILINQEEQF